MFCELMLVYVIAIGIVIALIGAVKLEKANVFITKTAIMAVMAITITVIVAVVIKNMNLKWIVDVHTSCTDDNIFYEILLVSVIAIGIITAFIFVINMDKANAFIIKTAIIAFTTIAIVVIVGMIIGKVDIKKLINTNTSQNNINILDDNSNTLNKSDISTLSIPDSLRPEK